MQENVLKRVLFISAAAFFLGMVLPFFLPDDWFVAVTEMVNGLFTAFSAKETIMWQSFGSGLASFAVWLLVLWCCGWLPVCWPGLVVIVLRALLFGFSVMLLCKVDYAYGLLTWILLLLPGELVLLGSLILLSVPAQNLSVSLKKREPCFTLRRYLALGVFCLLPAVFGSWLKACAGPWFLELVLGWI